MFSLFQNISLCVSHQQQRVYRVAGWLHALEDRWLLTPCCEWWRNFTWFQMGFRSYSSKTEIYIDDQQMTINIVCYNLFLNYLCVFKRNSKSVTFFSLNLSGIKPEIFFFFFTRARTRETSKEEEKEITQLEWNCNLHKGTEGFLESKCWNTFKVQLLLEVTVKILLS